MGNLLDDCLAEWRRELDKKDERIAVLVAMNEKKDAEIARLEAEEKKMADGWERMYAGRECPKCGYHGTMNVEGDLPEAFAKRFATRDAAAREAGARSALRFHYADSEEPELSEHVDGIIARWLASTAGKKEGE